ncbi:DegT/DnrJ/EryC1/StrS family aminotransferase [Saccharopolyspora sp. 5N102]|uniref:DegT/DnrJ/EryC1/StrS family aminotransferase n=1 Tax=Saccharopolyspora sp. 5N102 TaxID=3375155 RepID=UPI0037BCC796
MGINVWSYLAEYEAERADLLEAVDKVFSSGQLVHGASVRSFEAAFAEMHGRPHCVGVDNGTNALGLGLRALGVGPGDEVITVSNTAAPTIVAIDAVGATPVFVDVDPDTYLMDAGELSSSVTERTRCILPVHLYGQAVDMRAVRQVAQEFQLAVLEDCAQAHGARQAGQIVGSFGDAAAFSFYPTKVLGAYGDGGAVIVEHEEVAATLRRLRYYGMNEGRYYVVETPGFNSRLDEVQAEILLRKLGRLEQYISARRAIAETYDAAFTGTDLGLPKVVEGNEHVYYLYVVRHPARDEILRKLKDVGINLNVSYPWPVHTMAGFEHLERGIGTLPVTERLANEIFSLPMYPTLTVQDQGRVIDELLRILDRL